MKLSQTGIQSSAVAIANDQKNQASKSLAGTLALSLGLLVAMTFASFKALAVDVPSVKINGNSNTAMGEYTISEMQSETINGDVARKFELKYANAKFPIYIYLVENAKCRNYIVRSTDMEVKYVCRKSGFGAEKLYGKEAKFNPEKNEIFMNLSAYDQQRKISEGLIPEEKALGLIACYFPSLVKYTDLL